MVPHVTRPYRDTSLAQFSHSCKQFDKYSYDPEAWKQSGEHVTSTAAADGGLTSFGQNKQETRRT